MVICEKIHHNFSSSILPEVCQALLIVTALQTFVKTSQVNYATYATCGVHRSGNVHKLRSVKLTQ